MITKEEIFAEKLEVLKQFQCDYPESVLGGSIGLFLHGVDLKRDLTMSDLDFCMPDCSKLVEDRLNSELVKHHQENSGSDFRHKVNLNHKTEGYYTKVEISERDCDFVYKYHEGFMYKLQTLSDILLWKAHYAFKGISKHKEDLQEIIHARFPSTKPDPNEIQTFIGKYGLSKQPTVLEDDGLPF
jgi:hypothetical protein